MPDTMSPRLRVMLLEDHLLVRRGMELLLKQHYGLDIVGSFCSSQELFEALNKARAHVVVTDYALGPMDLDGTSLIRALRKQRPRMRILVVSSHCNLATMVLAMKAGAHGFIGKTEHEAELYAAIRTVAAGRTYVGRHLADPSDTAAPMRAIPADDTPGKALGDGMLDCFKLSPREHEVLRCMLDGMSITAIAQKFSRKVATVSAQKHSAFRKLGVGTSHELFKLRYRRG
jgi:DNA-binding NarL/FixJ family response regulator